MFLILVLFSAFFIWASNASGPGENARKAMTGNERVEVIHNKFIRFIPEQGSKKGLIIYPGAKVNPQSYAEIALEAAEAGVFSAIVSMPLNLAVFSPDKAAEVIAEYPEIDEWYLAGHSLGGAMACQYVKAHPETITGLILLAAYPASASDLSDMDVRVLSLYASEDGLSTVEKIEVAKEYLPDDTEYVLINGGNHAQFGDYGRQNGDGEAWISPFEQMQRIEEKILDFINSKG